MHAFRGTEKHAQEHRISIQNISKLETTQIFIKKKMEKLWYIHTVGYIK